MRLQQHEWNPISDSIGILNPI